MSRILKVDLGLIYAPGAMREGINTAKRLQRLGRVGDSARILNAVLSDLDTAITVLEACAVVDGQGKLLEADIFSARSMYNEARRMLGGDEIG